MIKYFNFRYNDLIIDYDKIIKDLGFEKTQFPDPFPGYLEQVERFATDLKDIRGCYVIVENVTPNNPKAQIATHKAEFKVGKTIAGELRGASWYAFFICTGGETISIKSQELLYGEDPVLGYVYDLVGSAIAEAAGNKIHKSISQKASKEGLKTTNRYSPGYCHWNVKDQHKLFSLFQGQTCSVKLTPSALMQPVKSISGVIGIGANVQFNDYQCTLCTLDNCMYRGK